MSTDELMSRLEKLSDRELLVDATSRYLFSLPPAVADAAFRCAILRWFNAEALEGILGVSALAGTESFAPDKETSPANLYGQLRHLRFAEEYPGRGHSFHDLTRELILEYLWHNQLDFYRQVSARAVEYFQNRLSTQIGRSERNEIDPSEIDWDILVEIAYHYFIRDEQEAVKVSDGYLDYLLQQRSLGTYHAIIQALLEHVKAGRLSSVSKLWIELWKVKEANANFDIAQSESIARGILQSPESSANPAVEADATFLLANSLLMASRYDEAKSYFEDNVRQCEKLENPIGALNALVGLGDVEFHRENHEIARNYFAEALSISVQQLCVPPSEDSEFGSDTPLRMFEPDAWHRRELYFEEEADEQEKGSPLTSRNEDTSQARIIYVIEFDLEKLGIDTSSLGEASAGKYEWPLEYDNILAYLWLRFAYLSHAEDEYDVAASCARLAGQLYMDMDNLTYAQYAVQLLKSLGANLGDLEYVKTMGELQHELLGEAVARSDQRAELRGLISKAYALHNIDKHEESSTMYERAFSLAESLNLISEKATCLDGMARLNWINNEYDMAVKKFNGALELYRQVQNREGEADTLLSLGDLYVGRYKLTEAEQYYLQATDIYEHLRTFSGQLECRLKLAELTTVKGDYENSFAYFNQALGLSRNKQRLSSEADVLSKIGALCLSLGDHGQAREAFDQALSIAKRIGNKQLLADILLNRADLLSDLAEYALAVQMCDQVIEFDPGNSRAHSAKCWALQNLGKDRAVEAKQAYEKASELRLHDWWVHKGIANALRLAGNQQAAIAKYRWVVDQIEKEGVTPAFRSTLAWSYYHLGEYEKAEDIYWQEVRSDPDSISNKFDLGLVLFCHGQYTQALRAYEQSVGLLQQRYPPRRRLGLIYVAVKDLQEAIEMHPKLSEVDECTRVQELLKREWKLASDKVNAAWDDIKNAVEKLTRWLPLVLIESFTPAEASASDTIVVDPDEDGWRHIDLGKSPDGTLKWIVEERVDKINQLGDLRVRISSTSFGLEGAVVVFKVGPAVQSVTLTPGYYQLIGELSIPAKERLALGNVQLAITEIRPPDGK